MIPGFGRLAARWRSQLCWQLSRSLPGSRSVPSAKNERLRTRQFTCRRRNQLKLKPRPRRNFMKKPQRQQLRVHFRSPKVESRLLASNRRCRASVLGSLPRRNLIEAIATATSVGRAASSTPQLTITFSRTRFSMRKTIRFPRSRLTWTRHHIRTCGASLTKDRCRPRMRCAWRR